MRNKKNGRPLKAEGKRTKFIKARVTEEEYTLLQNLWLELGLKESDFLRMKLLRRAGKTVVNSGSLLKSMDVTGAEIRRSGNNINQLARHANFLNKRGMLSEPVVMEFNSLFTAYIKTFREMETIMRTVLRLMKN